MFKYSGSTTFTFDIERYRDKETGEYFLEKDLPPEDDEGFEFVYTTITLTVNGSAYPNTGPYEEGVEIDSIVDDDGNDWEYKITESERSCILEDIQENCELQFECRLE